MVEARGAVTVVEAMEVVTAAESVAARGAAMVEEVTAEEREGAMVAAMVAGVKVAGAMAGATVGEAKAAGQADLVEERAIV